MYLLGEVGGYRYQDKLWTLRGSGRLRLADLNGDETDRAEILMEQYRNVPMDLADASLIAVAESRGIIQIFTLDSDFYVYRLADGSVLPIIR
jgi:predicted nucleic acid-binding protein